MDSALSHVQCDKASFRITLDPGANNALVASSLLKVARTRGLTMPELQAFFDSPRCWSCDKCAPNFPCEGCDRVYHFECSYSHNEFVPPLPLMELKPHDSDVVGVDGLRLIKCYECILATRTGVSEMKEAEQKHLNLIYFRIIKAVEAKYKEDKLRRVENSFQMDIETILNRAKAGAYITNEGFFADVRRVLDSSRYCGETSGETNLAKEFQSYVKDELRLMTACWPCYINNVSKEKGEPLKKLDCRNALLALCKAPHGVYWVKYTGYGYWPAKIISYDDKKDRVFVHYFGDGTREWVGINHQNTNIYLYSTAKKFATSSSKRKREWTVAVRDTKEYLRKVEEKFGDVNWLSTQIKFDGNLEQMNSILFPEFYQMLTSPVEETMDTSETEPGLSGLEFGEDGQQMLSLDEIKIEIL